MIGSAGQAPEVISLNELSSEIVREWRSLAVSEGSYFQTPDWVMSWWRHLVDEPRTLVALWRAQGGALEAMAAMSQLRERIHPKVPLSVPLFINAGSGIGAADHCGFPGSALRSADIASWIDTLEGSARLQSLSGPDLVVANGWRRVDTIETFDRPLSLDIPIVPSSSMAKDLRRQERRIAERGVSIEVLQGAQLTDEILDALFRLHAERFDARGVKSVFSVSRRPQLAELISVSTDRCGPVATVGRHASDVVGVHLSFLSGSRLHYYQSGWSPEYRSESLGNLLIVAAMKWAQENGVTTFDFLRGSDQYKDRFGVQPRPDESFERRTGASGAVLAAKWAVRKRVRSAALR